MKKLTIIFTIIFLKQIAFAQNLSKIETCNCQFKADSSLKTECGYLVVPENRSKPNSKLIKLPYIFVKSNNPNKKLDPVLFTTGGPGGSSLNSVESIHYFDFIKDRDFIAFEQRGTKYAQPCLECEEVNVAIKDSYLKNLSKDSLINIAVKNCRKKLLAKGIDIAAYNTAENTNDIEDLRKTLKIDSINLIGLSYSAGLMLNVLRKYPNHIRSLVLDSPLPLSVNIDEDELANFNEALHQVFVNDFASENKLKNYLLANKNTRFTTNYVDSTKKKTFKINYSSKEIIDIIGSKISDESDRNAMPKLANDLINGNHKPYIDEYFQNIFNDNSIYSGMRLSVYCSDKIAFADQKIAAQQYKIHPYFTGYNANDVTFEMCKCWNISPINAENKKPFYANSRILLGAGNFDPACRPLYNDILQHYFPNSQRLLFMKKAHGVLLSLEGNPIIAEFLNNPLKKIISTSSDIKTY